MRTEIVPAPDLGSGAHAQNWLRWLGHLKDKPGVCLLEIGVWKGEGAEWFLSNILTHPTSSYCGVDPFTGSEEHRLAGMDCSQNEQQARERLKPFGARAALWRETSTDFLIRNQGWRGFDAIYVDGSHTAEDVLRDSVLAFELLRVGGTVIWDDVEWKAMRDEIDRPKMAVEAFCACYARRIEIIGMGWQWAARKVA